jgi:hypothetical protein
MKLSGETMKKLISGVLLTVLVLLQSCGYFPAWWIEKVHGATSSIGTYTSLALDSMNNPHIIYCDEDTKQKKI